MIEFNNKSIEQTKFEFTFFIGTAGFLDIEADKREGVKRPNFTLGY